jgi:hypothetical protein
MRLSAIVLSLAVTGLLLVGCGGSAAPTPLPVIKLPTKAPPTETPVPADDEEAVTQLILAEGEGVVQQDIDRLMDIWADDGEIRDAKHTPDDESDDDKWTGKEAIRQRYANLVFPSAPMQAEATDLQVSVEDSKATVTATTNIGDETSPSGDIWDLEKRNGRWYIVGLTYNLEAN